MTLDKNFDAARAEAEILARWLEAGAFRAGANASRDETFCIMIPPPNVTGSLHVGHAFNNTLQDILVRWHRMRGFDTLWQPGTDHAGIATQLAVEKELARTGNLSRREMGREKFLEKVWEWKEQSGGTIVEQLKRLGASCDWDREAFTMSGNFPDAVMKVFVDLYNKGLIYRGKRLVNWDPHFETAISDLEVENVEVQGHMWHFKYPLAGGETYEYVEKDLDGNVTLRETRDYIAIATTRPETMLGDGAVAVHPSDERYAPIVGKLVHLPLCDRLIPIITDEYPDPLFGSGAVKITGAHDFNDYAVAMRNGIELYRLMDTRGVMRADAAADNLVPEQYRGLDRFEARKLVVADIDALGLMDFVEDKKIMQPFGDRSKVVIEPMLTDQWYVDAKTLAGPALAAVKSGEVAILPERDKKVYYHWLENIEPWCISRQLWWGHQVPVWYGPKLKRDFLGIISGTTSVSMDETNLHEVFCAPSEADVIAQATKFYEDQGVRVKVVFAGDADVQRDGQIDRAKAALNNAKEGFIEITLFRDPDVLDTWFSSGLWPIGTLGWPDNTPELQKYYPTSVLVTGFDILFFWVARMMMMQLEVVKQVPFHTVYLHALVRDEKGVKMSKSLGNVLDPLELIDEFGADALRFTLTSMAALGGTLKLSRERIAGYRNFGTKLWNAARFAEMNGCVAGAVGVPKAEATVNRWIIGETARVREVVDKAFTEYRFNEAALALYAHVWGKVCDWYVELAKPLLQGEDERYKTETQGVMAWVLDQCLILLHPVMPFITEELWGQTGARSKMLVHGDWPTYGAELADGEADAEMGWVIGLIEGIRSVRAEMHVNAGAKVPLVALGLDAVALARLERNRVLIGRLARVERFEFASVAPKGAVTLPVEGGAFCLPLADVIDVSGELARLVKTLAKLEGELNGLKGKTANVNFMSRAPEEVVAQIVERIAEGDEEAAKIRAAMARLQALR